MTLHKGSLGLSIAGNDVKSSVNLFTPSEVMGIKTSSEHKTLHNSIAKYGELKFESQFASSVLGKEWHAESIKIANDVAVVSYPKYTDINKVVITDTNGGLYKPYYHNFASSSGGGDCSYDYYQPYHNSGFFLPDLNISSLIANQPWDQDPYWFYNKDVDFSNLYIIVEYDGYYTDNNGLIQQRDLDKGRYEVFKYGTGPSTWGYKVDSSGGGRNKIYPFPMLQSKYDVGKYTNEFYSTITHPRLNISHVTDHDFPALDFLSNKMSAMESYPRCFRYGFMGCKSVTYVKYTPVIECGRVDLYSRKYGDILGVNNDVFLSPNHRLQSGDIIEIVATNRYGKNEELSGVKYVQVVSDQLITLYEDPDMTRKCEVIDFRVASFNCIGNVYNKNSQGWKYEKTIYSPHGRNGQSLDRQEINLDPEPFLHYDAESETPLNKEFAKCETMDEIFYTDYFNGLDPLTNPTSSLTDDDYNINGLMPTRRNPSGLDCLWINHEHLAHSYQFGSSIDVRQEDGFFYLAVGEKGPDRIFTFSDHYLPYHHPQGKVFIMNVSRLPDKSVSINASPSNVIKAHHQDPSIPTINVSRFQSFINYRFSGTFLKAPSQTAKSAADNSVIFQRPHHFNDFSLSSGSLYSSDYWYGCLVAARGIIDNDSYEDYNWATKTLRNSIDSYDPNYDIIVGESAQSNYGKDAYIYYPFINNFGKSVALSQGKSRVLAITSMCATNIPPVSDRMRRYAYDPVIYQPSDYMFGVYDLSFKPELQYGDVGGGYLHLYSLSGYGNIGNYTRNYFDIYCDSYYAQEYALKRFGSGMKFIGDDLYVGVPRSPDMVNINNQSMIPMEASRIDIYNVSDTTSSMTGSILNTEFSPLVIEGSVISINEKELTARGDTERREVVPYGKLYNSDRFGEYIDGNSDIIATNAFSTKNDMDQYHHTINPTNIQIIDFHYIPNLDIKMTLTAVGSQTPAVELVQCIERPNRPGYYYVEVSGLQIREYDFSLVMVLSINHTVATDSINITANQGVFYPETLTDGTPNNTADGYPPTTLDLSNVIYPNTADAIFDYIFVFDRKNGNQPIAKLSPSINAGKSEYSSINKARMKRINNKTYDNDRFNSHTWNTDLSSSFVCIDEIILLKDPIGYAIFDSEKKFNCVFDAVVSFNEAYSNPVISFGPSYASFISSDNVMLKAWSLFASDTASDGESMATYDIGTSFELNRRDGLPMYLNVISNISSNIDMNMYSMPVGINDINMNISGGNISSSNIDMYIGPSIKNEFINLVIVVSNVVPPTVGQLGLTLNMDEFRSLDLVVKGADSIGSLDAILASPELSESNLDMYLQSTETIVGDADMLIEGGNYQSHSVDLYLENYPENSSKNVLPLFIGFDPMPISGSVNMFMRGSSYANTYHISGDTWFHINASGYGSDDSVPLYINGPEFGSQDDSIPLFLSNESISRDVSDNLSAIITGYGDPVFFNKYSGSKNFVMKASEKSDDWIPLFIKQTNEFGNEESYSGVNMVLANNNADSGVTISIEGISGVANTVNFVMAKTTGLQKSDVKLFIRGYEE